MNNKVRKRDIANDVSFSYPRSESNRDRQNRNLKFYPLNYRGNGSGLQRYKIFLIPNKFVKFVCLMGNVPKGDKK